MYFSSCLFRKVLFLCIRNLFYIDIDNTRNNFSVSKFFEGLLLLLSEFFFYPLLGRARFRDWCWAAIRLSYRPEPSGHTVHEEVDGLDIGGQHGRRFVLLRHTHRLHRPPYPICTNRGGNVRHRCEGGWARPRLFLGTSFREGGYRCLDLKCGVLWDCLPTPHSIDDPPTAPHVCCCCQKNWWVAVRRVQMGVSIWGAVHLHSMDGWALSGADVQAPWVCRVVFGNMSSAAPWEGRCLSYPTLNTSSASGKGGSRDDRFGKHFRKCCNSEGPVKASVLLPVWEWRRYAQWTI